jgi:hypothetical protein
MLINFRLKIEIEYNGSESGFGREICRCCFLCAKLMVDKEMES